MIKSSCIKFNIQDNPFRLISLREILMQAVQVSDLVVIGHDLMVMRVPEFLKFIPKGGAEYVASTPITEEQSQSALEYFQKFQKGCLDAGLTFTLPSVNRAVDRLKESPSLTYSELSNVCLNLLERLTDELDQRLFLSVEPKYAPYYDNPTSAWVSVIASFPNTSFDIEEGTKCLALNRYTACVFHLNRVAEIGSVVIGQAVGYKDPKPSLHSVLNYLENALRVARENYAQANPCIKENVDFYAEVVVHMHAVNQAWRQRVSHMDKKYTEEEALRIYGAILSLMVHTATRLSETGAS